MVKFYKRNGLSAYDAITEVTKGAVILNHVRDEPDSRDFKFGGPKPMFGPTPPSVDLRSVCPPILNQGGYGSCQSNCVANALMFDLMKQGMSAFGLPSRLFIYYNARALTGIQHGDPGSSGASIRNTIKAVAQSGYCPETDWPYSSPPNTKPSQSCYNTAKDHKSILYQRVDQKIEALKNVLSQGLPICWGASIYWASFDNGVANMPSPGESLGGGHATVIVGYDDGTTFGPNRFLVMNSWGAGWGLSGYFTIPYEFVLDPVLAFDFWVIQHVS